MTRRRPDAALGVTGEPLLALPSADPPIDMDADLRPEKTQRSGWLVHSCPYRAYYRRWSASWRRKRSCVRGRSRVAALQDAFIE